MYYLISNSLLLPCNDDILSEYIFFIYIFSELITATELLL